MAVISNWDLLSKYVKPGEDLQLGSLDFNPNQSESEAVQPKSGWERFGQILRTVAPIALAGYALATPQNGIMYGSAAQAWQQAKELERQAEAQRAAQDLAMKNYLLNQQEFELKQQQLADEKAQQQEAQKAAQQKAQENYDAAITALDTLPDNDPRKPALKTAINYAAITGNYDDVQKLLSGLIPETPKPPTALEQAQIREIDAKIANMGKEKTKTTQPTQQQVDLARQISAQAGKYKRKVDYLADLRRYRSEIINQIGSDLYNQLFAEANNLSENIWPTTTQTGKNGQISTQAAVGAQFIPGSTSPIRQMLGVKRPQTVATKPTQKTSPHGKVVRTGIDKKTGKKVVQYADGFIDYQS